jgi:hypothetical protein
MLVSELMGRLVAAVRLVNTVVDRTKYELSISELVKIAELNEQFEGEMKTLRRSVEDVDNQLRQHMFKRGIPVETRTGPFDRRRIREKAESEMRKLGI